MLKYVNTGIVFQEIPEETTLAVNISNCPCHCPGCHSQFLWQDIGTVLDRDTLDKLIGKYVPDITCVCFMGGDAEPEEIDRLAEHVRDKYPDIHIGWYSGRTLLSKAISKSNFDYIKIGPYIRHLGPLNKRTTNQRLYKIMKDGEMKDITSAFWKK